MGEWTLNVTFFAEPDYPDAVFYGNLTVGSRMSKQARESHLLHRRYMTRSHLESRISNLECRISLPEDPRLAQQSTQYAVNLYDKIQYLQFQVPPATKVGYNNEIALTISDPAGAPLDWVSFSLDPRSGARCMLTNVAAAAAVFQSLVVVPSGLLRQQHLRVLQISGTIDNRLMHFR